MQWPYWEFLAVWFFSVLVNGGGTETGLGLNNTLDSFLKSIRNSTAFLAPKTNYSWTTMSEEELLFELSARFAWLRFDSTISKSDVGLARRQINGLRLRNFRCADAYLPIAGTSSAIQEVQWPSASGALQSAECCDEAKQRWARVSMAFLQDQINLFWLTSTYLQAYSTTSLQVGSCTGPFTTLCDGVARAMCTPRSPMTTFALSHRIYSYIKTSTRVTILHPLSPPQCTIAYSDCLGLWEQYYTSRTSIFLEEKWPPTRTIWLPACTLSNSQERNYLPCTGNGQGLNMNLLYWSSTADEQRLCTSSMLSTTSPTRGLSEQPSGTVIFRNWTLTSPTAYAYFSTLRYQGLGKDHSNIVIPLDADDINLIHRSRAWDPSQRIGDFQFGNRMEFADLAYQTVGSMSYPLVPASKYRRQEKCDLLGLPCSTIYHDYDPKIFFRMDPKVLRSIDPAWERCGYEYFVGLDPPIVLNTAERVALPEPTTTTTRTPPPKASFPTTREGMRPGALPSISIPLQTPKDPPIGPPKRPQDNDGGGATRSTIFAVPAATPSNTFIGPNPGDQAQYANNGNNRQQNNQNSVSDSENNQQQQHNQDPQPLIEPTSDPAHNPSSGHSLKTAQEVQNPGLIFTAFGKTFTATPLGHGTFVLDGTTFSSGGNQITRNEVVITAFDSGIIVESSKDGIRTTSDSSESSSLPGADDPGSPGSSSDGKPSHRKGAASVLQIWRTFLCGQLIFLAVLLY